MAEGEGWDLGDRSPRHEIRPRLPRQRNNSRWIPLPQPASPLSASHFSLFFILLSPIPPQNLSFPCQQSSSVQGSITVFLSKTIFNCLFGCLRALFCVSVKKKKSRNDSEGIAVFCMYVFFSSSFSPVPAVLFHCHFVEMGSCPSVM